MDHRASRARPSPDAGSFRDHANRVFHFNEHIWRGMDAGTREDWRLLSEQEFFQRLVNAGKVVRSQIVPPEEWRSIPELSEWAAVLTHERIPFITYPYEWPFGMLKDAALLHLDTLEAALKQGWTMKDASAFNVQWRGRTPVFIDTPSFQPRAPGTGWIGYRQFCMMFLFPLMLRSYRGVDYHPLLRSSLDGIDPVVANRILTGFSRFRSGVLSHVYFQAKLQQRARLQEMQEAATLTESGVADIRPPLAIKHTDAMVIGLVQSLARIVGKMQLTAIDTVWQDYASSHSYAEQSLESKKRFVNTHIAQRRWGMIWDLGCNTGTFSEIAATQADNVVAMDGDANVVESLYQLCKSGGGPGNILPIVLNLANPSPGQGWRGLERKPIDERGRPELILCLALIHHLAIGSNVPLTEIVDWLHELGGDLIVEFVDREDAMVKMLLRNRVDPCRGYSLEEFERACALRYETIASDTIKGGTRKLYYLKRRTN